jgi:hypothetical protein
MQLLGSSIRAHGSSEHKHKQRQSQLAASWQLCTYLAQNPAAAGLGLGCKAVLLFERVEVCVTSHPAAASLGNGRLKA